MKDVLDKQKERAIETLKQMSEKEKDIVKKLDLDYVITVLTNKPYGGMPFQEDTKMDILIRNITKEELVKIIKCDNCDASDMDLQTYYHSPDEIVCNECGSKIEISEVK